MKRLTGAVDNKNKHMERNIKLEYHMSVNASTYDHNSDCTTDTSSVIAITRAEKEKKTKRTDGVSIGFPKYRWLLLLGDLILITMASILSSWIRFSVPLNTLIEYTIASTITLCIYPATLYIFDLYNIERSFRSWETAYRSAFALGLGGSLTMVFFYLVPYEPYGRGIMAIQLALSWSLLNGWRWAYGFLFQVAIRRTPALILGAGNCGKTIYGLLKSPLSSYEIKGFLDDAPDKLGRTSSPAVIGTCDQLTEIAARVGANTAILAIPKNRSTRLIRNILEARLKGINIRDMADVYEELTGRIPVRNIGDQWLLFAEGFYLLRKEYVQRLKRLLDFVASGLILFLTLPIISLTALAIRLDSPGPILYKQRRVGKGQREFMIYKFRSMYHDAEKEGARWAIEKDPRVTRIGRILRLTHIDEIPQIWNILSGDMSMVGPRPERPEFVEMLEKEIPYYFVRHSVKPGMTGWAQISYRYGASVEDSKNKLECDLYYIKNMSLFLDFKILLRTIGVVLLGDGAR
jgi:sugar transferase (PEP-CTERM system associated)